MMIRTWFRGVAAAVVAGAAFSASADGMSVQVPFGFTVVSVCAKPAEGDGLSIDDIDVRCLDADESPWDKVFLMKLDDMGEPARVYQRNDWAYDIPCWVERSFDRAEVTFVPGEAIMVQSNCGTVELTFNGAPLEDAVTVPLGEMYNCVGNPFAEAIDLLSIEVEGVPSNYVELEIRKPNGTSCSTIYTWDAFTYDESCWVDGDWEPVEAGAVSFDPGTGFIVTTSESGLSLVMSPGI